MKLSKIKNNPNNPRVIKDDKFQKLVKSISEFPKMMALRPIIVTDDFVVLGGNMRLRALQELGYKEIPDDWIKKATELSDDEKRRFVITDNVGFGEHDWDMLANEWDSNELLDWGLDIPSFDDMKGFNDIDELEKPEENSPKGTDDGYSTFELVMLHENKLQLLETINKVKTNFMFEKMEDALMEIIRVYNK